MIHQLTTKVRYRLTWKSDHESSCKEASFAYREEAERWYAEKLAESKNPKLWKEKTTTTFEAMRPQEES